MATPDDTFDLEVPTLGWAFLHNGYISWLTKAILTTTPSTSAGTVVELQVHHKRGRATSPSCAICYKAAMTCSNPPSLLTMSRNGMSRR